MKTNNLMKLLFAVSLLLPAEVLAQETSGVEAFKQNRDAWRRQEQETTAEKKEITQKMRDTIPANALRHNIGNTFFFAQKLIYEQLNFSLT